MNNVNKIEIKEKRNLNSKHFYKGNGEFIMNAHVGHIHYYNKLGIGDGEKRFREIDFNLKFDEVNRGWYFDYHSFIPFLPEYSDDWVEFRDLFNDKDQTIRYKAVCNRVKGRLVIPYKDDKISGYNYVVYDNAFGEGIDYILYFTRSTLKKVVRIRDSYKKNKDYTFDFEFDDSGKEIKRGAEANNKEYTLDKTKDKEFDTDKQTLIGNNKNDGKEWYTYLRGFKVWDYEKSKTIKVKRYIKNDKVYLQKLIPKEFINNSIGDVFTDTTTSYYAGAGDGEVNKQDSSNWDTVHDATTGQGVQYTDASNYTGFCGNTGANFWIARGFFPIDTSGLTSGAIITAATLYVKPKVVYNGDADGDNFLTVVQSDQPSSSALTTSDYNNCGATDNPTEGVDSGDRFSLNSASSGTYMTWSFNSTGMGWISKIGTTLLGMREGHDVLDKPFVGSGAYNGCYSYNSEQSGTDNDPYISIVYTVVNNWTKDLSETVSLSESIVKETGKALTDNPTLAESIQNSPTKEVSDNLSLAEALTKSVEINIAEVLNITDQGVAMTITKNIADSLSLTELLSKLITLNTAFQDNVNLAESLKLGISKGLDETINITDILANTISKNLTDSASLAEELGIENTKNLIDSLSISEDKIINVFKNLSENVSISEELKNTVEKNINDNLTLADNINVVKVILKEITDSIAISDLLYLGINKNILESVALVESLQKQSGKSLSDNFLVVETIVKGVDKNINDSEVLSENSIVCLEKKLVIQDNISIAETLVRDYGKSLLEALSITESLTTDQKKRLYKKTIVLNDKRDKILLISNPQ